MFEIGLGDVETIGGPLENGEPPQRGLRRIVAGHENAPRLAHAATDPSAQLVELRQPEPIGGLDDHDRGGGHIDPDLDDRGGQDDLDIAAPETIRDGLAFVAAEPTVEDPDLEPPSAARIPASCSSSAAAASLSEASING